MTPIFAGITTAPPVGTVPPQVAAFDHAPDLTAFTPTEEGAIALALLMSLAWWDAGAMMSVLIVEQETREAVEPGCDDGGGGADDDAGEPPPEHAATS